MQMCRSSSPDVAVKKGGLVFWDQQLSESRLTKTKTCMIIKRLHDASVIIIYTTVRTSHTMHYTQHHEKGYFSFSIYTHVFILLHPVYEMGTNSNVPSFSDILLDLTLAAWLVIHLFTILSNQVEQTSVLFCPNMLCVYACSVSFWQAFSFSFFYMQPKESRTINCQMFVIQ